MYMYFYCFFFVCFCKVCTEIVLNEDVKNDLQFWGTNKENKYIFTNEFYCALMLSLHTITLTFSLGLRFTSGCSKWDAADTYIPSAVLSNTMLRLRPVSSNHEMQPRGLHCTTLT